ncbi:MAG: type II toxin-antitoxin system RelE/ParE family toxin [Rickettsiales bacterium]
MANYKLTNNAESNLDNIYEYSILNFGLEIARKYMLGLHECFDLLAKNPTWGSNYGFICNGLLRYEYRSHAIYYINDKKNILILNILGGKQDPILSVEFNF